MNLGIIAGIVFAFSTLQAPAAFAAPESTDTASSAPSSAAILCSLRGGHGQKECMRCLPAKAAKDPASAPKGCEAIVKEFGSVETPKASSGDAETCLRRSVRDGIETCDLYGFERDMLNQQKHASGQVSMNNSGADGASSQVGSTSSVPDKGAVYGSPDSGGGAGGSASSAQ